MDRRPFAWSACTQAAIFLIALVAGNVTLFPSFTLLDVQNPANAIAASWQVLAGFASIAFAGLAVLMQLTSEPVVTSRGVRQVLFERSQFRPILAFSITGIAQVGAAALFLSTSEAAITEFLLVAATVYWIGKSYARVGSVYAKPGEALKLGEIALLRDLHASMRYAHSRAVADARLHALVPREWRWTLDTQTGVPLVSAKRTAFLRDIDIDMLKDVLNEVKDNARTLTATTEPTRTDEKPTPMHPELRIATAIESSVDEGQPIYLLANPDSFTGNLDRIKARLAKTLIWEDEA
jgi:hypothetical protein